MNTPLAPAKLPTKNVKSCGQVLTSTDLMERMEEAEKLKADKAKEKKERESCFISLREMKQLEKAKQKSIKGNKITINDYIAVLVICIVITGKKEKTITSKTLSKKQPSMFICTRVSISSTH